MNSQKPIAAPADSDQAATSNDYLPLIEWFHFSEPGIQPCVQDTPVSRFRDAHRFLSNFAACQIYYEGLMYPSLENAYQAAKCADVGQRIQFTTISPGDSKRLGRVVAMRKDWLSVRVSIMEELTDIKYRQYDFAQRLVDTGNGELSEGNMHGDTFWGVDLRSGIGENVLGQILMRKRDELHQYGLPTNPSDEPGLNNAPIDELIAHWDAQR